MAPRMLLPLHPMKKHLMLHATLLSRKWKDMVDDWVKKSSLETAYPSVISTLLPSDHPRFWERKRERDHLLFFDAI